ncbi:MAG: hypothetical protein COA82_06690 [Alkaliphilus sp.]|jgi:hypothetical protein|nr:MAG: hypothetical protein COA82_06690 [Alkaliphilus sp.]
MDRAQAMKNKMLRGQVLRTLALFYPDTVSISGIKTALVTRGVLLTANTNKAIYYVEDKGYIKIRDVALKEIEDDTQIELTAKGIDLLEGTTEDAGVDV